MHITTLALTVLLTLASTAFAADHSQTPQGKALLSNCKAELTQPPATKSLTNSEVAWRNLEVKEGKNIKFSGPCDKAEDNYERTFHHAVWQAEEAKEHPGTK